MDVLARQRSSAPVRHGDGFRVVGGALPRNAARAADGGDDLSGLQARAVMCARAARDCLLHEGAAKVVGAPAERFDHALYPHLDPAGLDVGDVLAEVETRQRGELE